MDLALIILVCLSFSTWICVHVALSVSIGRHQGRAKGWLSLFVVALAPYFGLRGGIRGKSVVWVLLALTYVVALFFAAR
ncbi:MAG: hypothetical protein QM784_20395 [Polyangiaceae bacterium]